MITVDLIDISLKLMLDDEEESVCQLMYKRIERHNSNGQPKNNHMHRPQSIHQNNKPYQPNNH